MDKTVPNAAAAVAGITDGAVLAIGGPDGDNIPCALVDAVRAAGVQNLSLVCREAALRSACVHELLASGSVTSLACSYSGGGSTGPEEALDGSVEVRRLTEVDLAARLEAAAAGITRFYEPLSEVYADAADRTAGGPRMVYGGDDYLREGAIRLDVALVRAVWADPSGNLALHTEAEIEVRMAHASTVTIVQADAMRGAHRLKSSETDVPGTHVNRVLMPRPPHRHPH